MSTVVTLETTAPADDVVEIPVIEFVRPLPGFPEQRQFALVRLDEDGDLCELASIEGRELRFLVMAPGPFFPEYEVEISDDIVTDLGVTAPEEVVTLLVVHAGDSLATTTANLLAPLVVNTTTRLAAQVVLADESLPVRAPLPV